MRPAIPPPALSSCLATLTQALTSASQDKSQTPAVTQALSELRSTLVLACRDNPLTALKSLADHLKDSYNTWADWLSAQDEYMLHVHHAQTLSEAMHQSVFLALMCLQHNPIGLPDDNRRKVILNTLNQWRQLLPADQAPISRAYLDSAYQGIKAMAALSESSVLSALLACFGLGDVQVSESGSISSATVNINTSNLMSIAGRLWQGRTASWYEKLICLLAFKQTASVSEKEFTELQNLLRNTTKKTNRDWHLDVFAIGLLTDICLSTPLEPIANRAWLDLATLAGLGQSIRRLTPLNSRFINDPKLRYALISHIQRLQHASHPKIKEQAYRALNELQLRELLWQQKSKGSPAIRALLQHDNAHHLKARRHCFMAQQKEELNCQYQQIANELPQQLADLAQQQDQLALTLITRQADYEHQQQVLEAAAKESATRSQRRELIDLETEQLACDTKIQTLTQDLIDVETEQSQLVAASPELTVIWQAIQALRQQLRLHHTPSRLSLDPESPEESAPEPDSDKEPLKEALAQKTQEWQQALAHHQGLQDQVIALQAEISQYDQKLASLTHTQTGLELQRLSQLKTLIGQNEALQARQIELDLIQQELLTLQEEQVDLQETKQSLLAYEQALSQREQALAHMEQALQELLDNVSVAVDHAIQEAGDYKEAIDVYAEEKQREYRKLVAQSPHPAPAEERLTVPVTSPQAFPHQLLEDYNEARQTWFSCEFLKRQDLWCPIELDALYDAVLIRLEGETIERVSERAAIQWFSVQGYITGMTDHGRGLTVQSIVVDHGIRNLVQEQLRLQLADQAWAQTQSLDVWQDPSLINLDQLCAYLTLTSRYGGTARIQKLQDCLALQGLRQHSDWLTIASEQGHVALVNTLCDGFNLDRQQPIHIPNNPWHGKTLWQIAEQQNHRPLLIALLAKGVTPPLLDDVNQWLDLLPLAGAAKRTDLVSELQARVSHLLADSIQQLQARDGEIASLQAQITAAGQTIQSHKTTLEQLRDKLKKLRAEHKELNDSNGAQTRRIEELSQHISQLTENLESQAKTHAQALAQQQALVLQEREQLQKSLADAHAQEAEYKQQAQAQLERLAEEKAQADRRNQELTQQLQALSMPAESKTEQSPSQASAKPAATSGIFSGARPVVLDQRVTHYRNALSEAILAIDAKRVETIMQQIIDDGVETVYGLPDIQGALARLNDDAYVKSRAPVESNKGNITFGDWYEEYTENMPYLPEFQGRPSWTALDTQWALSAGGMDGFVNLWQGALARPRDTCMDCIG